MNRYCKECGIICIKNGEYCNDPIVRNSHIYCKQCNKNLENQENKEIKLPKKCNYIKKIWRNIKK